LDPVAAAANDDDDDVDDDKTSDEVSFATHEQRSRLMLFVVAKTHLLSVFPTTTPRVYTRTLYNQHRIRHN